MKMFTCKFAQDEVTHQRLRVGSKKSLKAAAILTRGAYVIRSTEKLADFFNRPTLLLGMV
jgi:hypothetical protein